MAELQRGTARTTCEDAFAGHRDSPAADEVQDRYNILIGMPTAQPANC
jgi:hypothetical protein